MKTSLPLFTLAALIVSPAGLAQTDSPVVEDFKPSSLNQPGKQYPQVNSERRVRARILAPQATNVVFDFLGGGQIPPDQGGGRRLGRRHATAR